MRASGAESGGMKIHRFALVTLGASLVTASAFAQAPSSLPVPVAPQPKPSAEVGVSSRDGLTVSGASVLMTRNGATETLTKELELPNRLRIRPDGTITMPDGGKLTLRPSQVLTFDGQIFEAPVAESVAPKIVPVVPVVPVAPAPGVTPAAAEEAARVEAERRANATNKAPIKAGEGVQK